MSTLPKVRVKSKGSKVNIRAGTLPKQGAATLRVSSRKLAAPPQHKVQILRYAGQISFYPLR